MSTGDWNASHYKNAEFDSVARTYLGAADLSTQRKATKRMAGILLRDTPVITDYFINYVTASTSKVKNYVPEGISHDPAGEGRASPEPVRYRRAGEPTPPPARRLIGRR